ncbi:GyrI-like domain-containing protein [Paenibacillus sp. NPDC057967]|uniref:GyrI-like domain-containing protein n=1 Tax=Paenibacillus sp. NPDC057967 TaxID=3346293 RepID=UPI0036D8F5B7
MLRVQKTVERTDTKLVGFQVVVSLNQDLEEGIVVQLRERLLEKRHQIPNQKNDGMYLVQIYPDEQWTPDVPFTSMVAVEVCEFGQKSKEFVNHTIPAGSFVKVTHRGTEDEIGQTYDWISEQELCINRCFDFEYWAPKASFDQEDNTIDIYLPIENK